MSNGSLDSIILAAVVSATLLAAGGFSLVVRRHLLKLWEKTGDPDIAMARYRLLMRFGFAAVLLGCMAGVSFAWFPWLKSVWFPLVRSWRLSGGEVLQVSVFVQIFAYMGALLSIVVITLHGVERTIRGTTQTAGSAVRRNLLVVVFVALPAFLLPQLLNLIPSSWKAALGEGFVGEALPVMAVLLVLILIMPFLVPLLLGKTRAFPQGELLDRLRAFLTRNGLPKLTLRTWESVSSKTGNALVSGFFRPRVWISDYLIANLTPEELESVLAHELGHLKCGHLWIRSLLSVCAVPIFLAAGMIVNVPGLPPWGFFLFSITMNGLYFGFVFLFFTRFQEYQADSKAVEMGVPANVMIDALTRLAELNHMRAPTGKLQEKFNTHPAVERRINRLKKRLPELAAP